MSQLKGAEYLLDRYVTKGEPESISRNGIGYTVQRFQGIHKNEFLMRYPTGDVFLYENNVLKQKWKEDQSGKKSEEFIAYRNGRVDFRQRFQDILDQSYFYRVFNHSKEFRMEIWSVKTEEIIYHGEYNEKRQRDGWGIEYDEESGNMIVEGIWSNGVLKEVIRCFSGDTMTELKRNGEDSLDPTKRIPIYVGGFRYDEDNETFIREGKGCLIDEKSGIATREGEWKDGKEVRGVDLFDGWYNQQAQPTLKELNKPEIAFAPKHVTINDSEELKNLSLRVTDLQIASDCCNDVNTLDLKKFRWLQSIEIGNESFKKVQSFVLDGLKKLRSLKIGNHSFTQVKNVEGYSQAIIEVARESNVMKSFHIMNCESLESIEIGVQSFSDFGGDFELRKLNSLQSIQIGEGVNWSNNFFNASFLIQGSLLKTVIEYLDLPNLQSIQIGSVAFAQSLSIKLEGLNL